MDIERGKRLKQLRKNKKYSQIKVYNEIHKIMYKKSGTTYNERDGDSGKQDIYKFEKGKVFSIDNALAYAELFNVSLDYLYYGNKYYKPEYEDISKLLGFSNDALNKLEEINKKDKKVIDTLNKLLSPKISPIFIELLEAINEHSYIKTKSLVSQYPGNTFLNANNIKGYYKKPIMLKPEDLEYLSLFKISEISKKLADEIKNGGDKNEI